MARELGRDFALDRLQFIIGRRAGEIEEHGADAIEAAAAAFERLDRVDKSGSRGVAGDRIHFAARLLKRSLEGGREVTGRDALEWRRLERPGPGFEKRIRRLKLSSVMDGL